MSIANRIGSVGKQTKKSKNSLNGREVISVPHAVQLIFDDADVLVVRAQV